MNILLTGAAGQLGSELIGLLSAHGQVIATDRSVPKRATNSWVGLDISDGAQLDVLLNQTRPDLIVNAAAYTAVDAAESDSETAFTVNAGLPDRLSSWAKLNDARLIHYSTDYVFDGSSSTAYSETDSPDPQNVYGESKLAGEQLIAQSGCKHAILRTSWVYSSHGKNFVLSMLDLARRGLSLKVVDDQKGCPTWARNLALVSNVLIKKWSTSKDYESGVFHYRDDSILSWYEFAKVIFEHGLAAGLLENSPEISPVVSTEFPQPAKRPEWSVLNTQKITDIYDVRPAPFQDAVRTVINEIAMTGPGEQNK